MTNKKYSHRVTEDRVCKEIDEKYKNWSLSKKAQILATPINKIEWKNVISKAIWREKPFSDKKAEKGFRDAMIMETIVNSVLSDTSECQFVFLCKDEILRKSVEERLSDENRFSSFEYINDFKSYLDLKNEELETEFIRKITRRSHLKFFNLEDKTGLVYSENITQMFEEKYGKYFEDLSISQPKSSGLNRHLVNSSDWVKLGSHRYWVSSAQFDSKNDDGEYVWKSTVTYVQSFSREETRSLTESERNPVNYVLVLPFICTWTSKVTTDARFLKTKLVDIELLNNEFKQPSDEEMRVWELK